MKTEVDMYLRNIARHEGHHFLIAEKR